MSRLPDLVRDSKLDTRFHPKYVCHRYLESGLTPQERTIAREEYWKRVKHIGGGSFGSVWLEKCIKGVRDHDLRAVKEILRSSHLNKEIDYNRELEAMAKFSHPKVSSDVLMLSKHLTAVSVRPLFRPFVRMVRECQCSFNCYGVLSQRRSSSISRPLSSPHRDRGSTYRVSTI